jgi:hypothetical protein
MAIQRHRAERARCADACAAPGDIARPARSDVSNFGLAPIIHPLPQYRPAISLCQLASLEVTLSFREKFPIPKTAGKHEIVSRLWDGHLLSAMPQVAEELRAPLMVERYLILAKI